MGNVVFWIAIPYRRVEIDLRFIGPSTTIFCCKDGDISRVLPDCKVSQTRRQYASKSLLWGCRISQISGML